MERLLDAYGKITNVQKILGTIVAVLLMIWLGYESEIIPAQAAITQSKEQALALENEIAQLQEVNKSMTAIKDELRRAQDEMTTLKTMLPEEPQIEELLASMSSAAKSSGVTLVSFQPKVVDVPPPPPEAPPPPTDPAAPPPPGGPAAPVEEPIAYKTEIAVKVRGGFSQIVTFYDRALQFDRIVHMGDLAIEAPRLGANSSPTDAPALSSQINLESTITLFAFSQKAKVIPASTKTVPTGQQALPQSPGAPGAPPAAPPPAPVSQRPVRSQGQPSTLETVAERGSHDHRE